MPAIFAVTNRLREKVGSSATAAIPGDNSPPVHHVAFWTNGTGWTGRHFPARLRGEGGQR